MREMPQVSYVNGRWQLSTRNGTEMYVLRFHEYIRVDPSDWTFVKADLDKPEVRLLSGKEHNDLLAAGEQPSTPFRLRTPIEDEILTDLQTRWRALSLIAAF